MSQQKRFAWVGGVFIIIALFFLVKYAFFTPRYEPMDTTQIKAVAMGPQHTLFVLNDNTLWGVGSNEQGQLGVKRGSKLFNHKAKDGTRFTIKPIRIMDDVLQVAAGSCYSMALKKDGTVWVMGEKNSIWRQMDAVGTAESVPQAPNVQPEQPVLPTKIMDDVQQIASGDGHLLMLKTNGELWGMGCNRHGELGAKPDPIFISFPVLEPVRIATGVREVAAGPFTTFYITDDNTLYSCGANRYGELGYPAAQATVSDDGFLTINYPPRKVLAAVDGVYPGRFHTFMRDREGNLWHAGLTGSAPTSPAHLSPARVDAESVAFAVAGGSDRSPRPTYFQLLLQEDGTLWGQGDNVYGQLGSGEEQISDLRQLMDNVQAVWSYDDKVIILTKDGQLRCQGEEKYGELLGMGSQ